MYKKENDDDFLPTQYLNNENPYAFRKNYDLNLSSLSYNKEKLNTLHRFQPQKLNIVFDQKVMDEERKYIIGEAIKIQRKKLIAEAFRIIGKEPVSDQDAETVLEQFIDNEDILQILIDLKKTNLIYHQMRLRARVSHVLSSKIMENTQIDVKENENIVVDNLKEALIYTNLYKYYTS